MSIQRSESVLVEWSEIRTQGPANRALGLAEVKNHLRLPVDSDYYDDLLLLYIDSAIERVEHDTDRAMLEQTWQLWGHCFPQPSGYIPITRIPIKSVDSITYLDTDSTSQTVDAGDYYFDASRRLIYPNVDFVWPETDLSSKSVVVEFTAGSAAGVNVPAELLSGALLVISNMFYGVDVTDTYEMVIGRYKRSRYP